MDDHETQYRSLAEQLVETRDGSDGGTNMVEAYHAIISTIHGDRVDGVPAAVVRRASELFHEHRPVQSWWMEFDRTLARLLTSAVDDGPNLVMGLRGDDLRQCTLEFDDIRLDLEIQVDSVTTRDGLHVEAMVRGQLDSEGELSLPIEGVALDHESQSFAGHITTDTVGRFDVSLPAGSYDLVFKDVRGRHLLGVVTVP